MCVRAWTSTIISALFIFLFILFFCTEPVKPNFTAPTIENDKQILTYGRDIIDSVFGMYISAQGAAPLSFLWMKDGIPITTLRDAIKSDTLKFNTLALSDSGVYQCIVSNDVGADSSLLCTLAVTVLPTITKQPNSVSKYVGDNVTFSIVATGTKLTYQWQKGITNIISAVDSIYTIPLVTIDDDSTTYRCIVSNKGGRDTSEAAVLTVRQTFTVTYNGNGNTGGTAPKDVNAYETGSAVTVLGNTGNLVRQGHTFAGWNTASDGSGISFPVNTVFTMGKSNVILYALWTANPTYSVFYDGNGHTGGTVPLDTNRYETGTTVSTLGNTGNLVKTGYTFTRWNTKADGCGISYPPGVTFTMGTSDMTLFAQWTTNPTYRVLYDGNGHTGGNPPTDKNNYEAGCIVIVMGNTGNIVKTGNTFLGWNTAADGSGKTYMPGEHFTIGAANDTLFALWTINQTYTVTYNKNGASSGTVPVDGNNYQTGDTVDVIGNTGNLAKTGYIFDGWNTASDGSGIDYAPNSILVIDSANVILYAKWAEVLTYTVTYNGNVNTGGTVPIDANSYQAGATVTVMGNTGSLVKTGFNFTGWNRAADGSGTSYIVGATFKMDTADVTLYAKWTQDSVFTVTYDGNGATSGSVPVDANNYISGDTVTVLGNTGSLAKPGFTFTGWNTNATGSGTNYKPGHFFTVGSADITLYAKWTQSTTYKVFYDGNGATSGTAPIDANNYTQGEKTTVLGNTGELTKTGNTYSGWNTLPDGSGKSYNFGDTITIGTANDTLYAKWIKIQYTVKFNSQGGSPIDSQIVSYGDTATTPVAPTKTGYSFAGWFKEPVCINQWFFAFNTVTSDITLYAKWVINQYTVTYDGNGNTGGAPPSTTTHDYNTTVTVKDNTGALSKKGYSFTGWNTKPEGTGTSYTAGSTFTIGAANVTLYALWSINQYTVTYNGNGHTSGTVPAMTLHNFNTVVTVAANSGNLAKTGYTFACWNTSADGSGTDYTAGVDTFTIGAENVVLYAKWSINQYTVTFDSQGGTAVDSQMVNYGDTATTPVAPTKTGHTFGGWFKEASCVNQWIFSSDKVTKNVTLYAKWTINQYTVTYDGSGHTGGVPPSPTTHDYNTVVTVSGNTSPMVKTGHSFSGWNTKADGSGTDYAPGSTFTIGTSNVTLYAKWAINQYTVTYDGNGHTSGNPPPATIHNYNTTVTVQGNSGTLAKTGYTFAGWNTKADGTGTDYIESSTFTMGATNITLFAKWIVVDADGNVYITVTIGTQVWLVENLKTTKYNDGSDIPLVEDGTTWANLVSPGYCWYDNDKGTYKEPYGALYNWHTVNTGKLAPTGWHVPSDNEWNTLITYLGGENTAGGKLKEVGTTHWNSPNTGATNESGFTALPAGYRDDSGTGGYMFLGTRGHYWSSTEDDATNALCRKMSYDGANVLRNGDDNGYGFSVRCIRDY